MFRTVLNGLNYLLGPLNLRVDTLTREHQEDDRMRAVVQSGWFDQAIYAVPQGFLTSKPQMLLKALEQYRARFDSFRNPQANEMGYSFDNGFYTSPDTEVLYTMVRQLQPRRLVEIGCGNSTKIIRQAIKDGGLKCHHVGIDPQPRLEISQLVDTMIRRPIEHADATGEIAQLAERDILFIDTSHEVKPANDVAYIYGCLLHHLRPGAVVHIHDIFLPYEYPRAWTMELGLKWGEQYLVHTMLMEQARWEVLWAGHYLQRTMPDFDRYFPDRHEHMAQSLWLRRIP